MRDKTPALEYSEETAHKKAAKKQAPKKFKHKHDFADCVLEYNRCRLDRAHGFQWDLPAWEIGTYCRICGKIGDSHTRDYKWVEEGLLQYPPKWNEAARREFDPATRTLPFFTLKTPLGFDKFVDLTEEGQSNGT